MNMVHLSIYSGSFIPSAAFYVCPSYSLILHAVFTSGCPTLHQMSQLGFDVWETGSHQVIWFSLWRQLPVKSLFCVNNHLHGLRVVFIPHPSFLPSAHYTQTVKLQLLTTFTTPFKLYSLLLFLLLIWMCGRYNLSAWKLAKAFYLFIYFAQIACKNTCNIVEVFHWIAYK